MADVNLLYDLHQDRTLFSLTWTLNPPISLGSHKLHSLYWAAWSYCSAVSSLRVSLPTCAGLSLRILMKYAAQNKCASRALNLEDGLWGFLRETPSPIPEWLCERNHPQITRLRFNEVFRLQQSVSRILILALPLNIKKENYLDKFSGSQQPAKIYSIILSAENNLCIQCLNVTSVFLLLGSCP